MLYFFTPYSFDKKLFEAYDHYMSLVNDEDWVVFLDGDTAFLTSEWGHQILEYINKYPDTGLFTCYASRCHYMPQVRRGTDMDNTDILYHQKMAATLQSTHHLKAKEIDRRIAGHLMVIKKSTWNKIREEVRQKVKAQSKYILGVDTKISNALLKDGFKIRLMQGIYIFHYLRLAEGFGYKNHLK